MTLDELRALLSPDRLDEIAAHNCGASEVALGLASALVDALIERDTLRAGVERLTGERDARPAITREDARLRKTDGDANDRVLDALYVHGKGGE